MTRWGLLDGCNRVIRRFFVKILFSGRSDRVMKDFGVRFRVDDEKRFQELRNLFNAIKSDKDAESFRSDEDWLSFIPDSVKANFYWPTAVDREKWLKARDFTPIAISPPSHQIGATWNFFRVIESFETGEYGLVSCEPTAEKGVCEMHIDPWAYPYGGLGPLIALVESFGFSVIGVNEYGRYLTLDDLAHGRG